MVMKFGDKVRQLRRDKKLTQEQLADKIGVHLNTINRWENLTEPIDDLKKLVKLSNELGTTVAYLRGEEEKPTDTPVFISEQVGIKPESDKLGKGYVFYYEHNNQKIEVPASREFIDMFLKAIKEIQSNERNLQLA